jgi:hypothetical protein
MRRSRPVDCPLAEEPCFKSQCSKYVCEVARQDAAERVLYELASELSAASGRLVHLPLSDRQVHIGRILAADRHVTRLQRHLNEVLAHLPANFNPRDEYVNNMAIEIDTSL